MVGAAGISAFPLGPCDSENGQGRANFVLMKSFAANVSGQWDQWSQSMILVRPYYRFGISFSDIRFLIKQRMMIN